jgi:hypothetical protein
MATRKTSGARDWRACAPVPTGSQGPTQACSQTAGGTRSTTRGFRGAARSLARNVTERALTGTRKSSVDRGMIVHRPGPGGPHPDPPDCAADKPRIAGERSEGRC